MTESKESTTVHALLQRFVGWLSVAIPELHAVEVPRIGKEVDAFLDAEFKREKPTMINPEIDDVFRQLQVILSPELEDAKRYGYPRVTVRRENIERLLHVTQEACGVALTLRSLYDGIRMEYLPDVLRKAAPMTRDEIEAALAPIPGLIPGEKVIDIGIRIAMALDEQRCLRNKENRGGIGQGE